jgi:hypothetical protein
MPLAAAADGTFSETGHRPRRHHQHHAPGAPDELERYETPDPLRSDAVEARIQCVRQRTDLHDQLKLTGNRSAGVPRVKQGGAGGRGRGRGLVNGNGRAREFGINGGSSGKDGVITMDDHRWYSWSYVG